MNQTNKNRDNKHKDKIDKNIHNNYLKRTRKLRNQNGHLPKNSVRKKNRLK